MPINKKDYPPDWPDIAFAAKQRAGWRCEWCGAPHQAIIRRQKEAVECEGYMIDYSIIPSVYVPERWLTTVFEPARLVETESLTYRQLRQLQLTKVVLTTAHIDRNPGNNAEENLAALCQRCHLRHDLYQHINSRRYGRNYARDHQLKLDLIT